MTTIKNLDERIVERADSDVQKAIRVFRKEVSVAIAKLTGDSMSFIDTGGRMGEKPRKILEAMVGPKPSKWPSFIWRKREDDLRREIVGLLDPLARALHAPLEPRTEGVIDDDS